MSLMVVSARKENQGIKIYCPHCRMSSNYDISFMEDAIHHGDKVKCVVCGKEFSVVTKKARAAQSNNASSRRGKTFRSMKEVRDEYFPNTPLEELEGRKQEKILVILPRGSR